MAVLLSKAPAQHDKLTSKAYQSQFDSSSNYPKALQQIKRNALLQLRAIVQDSGISATIVGEVVATVQAEVLQKCTDSKLTADQLVSAFQSVKRWMDPCLPLHRICKEALRSHLDFDVLVHSLLRMRDSELLQGNLAAMAELLHR